jgi:anti-anti-sigma factor
LPLEVKRDRLGEVEILSPKGRLDTESAGDLELAIHECLNAGASRFVLDFSGVGYVSSAGLSAVLMLAKKVDGSGSLRLYGLTPNVRQVFDMAGFSKMLDIRNSREEALGDELESQQRALHGIAMDILKPQPLPKPSKVDPRIAQAARLLGALKPRGPTRAPSPAPAPGGGGQATLVSRAVKVPRPTPAGGAGKQSWLSRLFSKLFGGGR